PIGARGRRWLARRSGGSALTLLRVLLFGRGTLTLLVTLRGCLTLILRFRGCGRLAKLLRSIPGRIAAVSHLQPILVCRTGLRIRRLVSLARRRPVVLSLWPSGVGRRRPRLVRRVAVCCWLLPCPGRSRCGRRRLVVVGGRSTGSQRRLFTLRAIA